MKIQTWKVTGPVSVGDHLPNEKFTVKVHDNGVPVDAYWRKRQADELRKNKGYLWFPHKDKPKTMPGEEPPKEDKEQPAKSPAKSK